MDLDESQRASQHQFDRRSDHYGRSHVLADTSDLDLVAADAELSSGGAALDVATGGGHTALWLARRGFRLTVSDLSQRMLESASRLLADAGFACETQQHPAEALPYPPGTFALVSCRVAAHHFSDPAAFVREAARVLAPGGHLIIIDGTAPDANPEAEAWTHEVEKLRDPSHRRFVRPGQWTAFCEQASLTVRRCDVNRLKQPDLDWYFDTADTPVANREQVRALVRTASPALRDYFSIGEEDGKTIWWWPRVLLLAKAAG